MKPAFAMLDANKDGVLEGEELARAMKMLNGGGQRASN
jgi:Ca2+-binding EF-hand superfamily protein